MLVQSQCPVVPERSDDFRFAQCPVTLVYGHRSCWGRTGKRVRVYILGRESSVYLKRTSPHVHVGGSGCVIRLKFGSWLRAYYTVFCSFDLELFCLYRCSKNLLVHFLSFLFLGAPWSAYQCLRFVQIRLFWLLLWLCSLLWWSYPPCLCSWVPLHLPYPWHSVNSRDICVPIQWLLFLM